jgi:hypothetical protein
MEIDSLINQKVLREAHARQQDVLEAVNTIVRLLGMDRVPALDEAQPM